MYNTQFTAEIARYNINDRIAAAQLSRQARLAREGRKTARDTSRTPRTRRFRVLRGATSPSEAAARARQLGVDTG